MRKNLMYERTLIVGEQWSVQEPFCGLSPYRRAAPPPQQPPPSAAELFIQRPLSDSTPRSEALGLLKTEK